jgi:hypothetical protein
MKLLLGLMRLLHWLPCRAGPLCDAVGSLLFVVLRRAAILR